MSDTDQKRKNCDYQLAYIAREIAKDPIGFRAKRAAAVKRWRERHPEQWRQRRAAALAKTAPEKIKQWRRNTVLNARTKNLAAYQARCRAYHKKWVDKNREYVRKHRNEYRAKNLEKFRTYAREYTKKTNYAARKRWIATNWEYIHAYYREKAKEYREKYPERVHATQKAWRLANPAQNRALQGKAKRKRRALMAGCEAPGVDVKDWARILELFDHTCAYCKVRAAKHCDHVKPIAQGGADVVDNVVPACARCNHSKWKKLLPEWISSSKIAKASRQSFLLSTMNAPPIDLSAIQCEEYIRDWLQL